MTLPRPNYIALPLLLELERHGGKVTPGELGYPEFYKAVSRHFLLTTLADEQLKGAEGRAFVSKNSVDWGRNSLKEKGKYDRSQRGVRRINSAGGASIRQEIQDFGMLASDVELLVTSTETPQAKLGVGWNRLPRQSWPRSARSHPMAPPPIEPGRVYATTIYRPIITPGNRT